MKVGTPEEFRGLVRREADKVLDEGDMVLTMKNKVLIPNAGIDNSNTPDGEVVLWPKAPFQAAETLRRDLMGEFGLDELGILITDSHCQPLRMGTSGIAIGWAGFEGVKDERGAKDLYGREMRYTKIAVADDLACAANLLMGETDASVPFVLLRGAPVTFTDTKASAEDYFIAPEECLYRSLYNFK
jgi:coenzyme F420-0:L-glutamate ligase